MTDENPEYNGDKFNKDKLLISLIEPTFIQDIAKVLTHGAKKYGKNNWKKGLPEDEIIDALLRHLIAYRNGEVIDPESGLDHRDHIGCNLMFWKYLYPNNTLTQNFTWNFTSDNLTFGCTCGSATVTATCPIHTGVDISAN